MRIITDKQIIKTGIWISCISWVLSWIIFSFKFDLLTYVGFILYGTGLSGLIIFLFVPKIILIR